MQQIIKNITIMNHMYKLIELNASGNLCGINDRGIKDVNLES
jgi:hypothetical protein